MYCQIRDHSPWMWIMALLVVVSLLGAACAPAPAGAPSGVAQPPSETESAKLVVASFYPIDKVSGWDGLVKRFEEAHPNVQIEAQVTPGGHQTYIAKLVSQIAGGDPPDVVAVENNFIPHFMAKGILEDLTSYAEGTPGFSTEDFFPHLVDRYTVDGRLYGIPYDAQPGAMLFYNPALFDEVGAEYPNKDWTWYDLLEAAQKLTKVDADGNVERFGYYPCGGFNWNYFVYSNGGRVVDDIKHPTRSLLGEPKAIEGIQFFVDLMYKYKVTPAPQWLETLGAAQTCNDLFIAGKIAMLQFGFWSAVENPEAFKEMGVRMVMAPTGPDGTRAYPTGGTAYAILKASKHKDLAWKFITFFLGQVGYEEAYKAAPLGAIYPPAHMPSYEWYESQPIEFVDTIAPNKEAIQYIIFAPADVRWAEISSKCVDPEMDLILRGKKPVEPTMKAIAQCVNDALAKQK